MLFRSIGDGSLGSGLAYEGLNNAGASDKDFVVVLNDNEMSIAPNVGAMHKYLTSVQRNPIYNRIRSAIGDIADHAPGVLHDAGKLLRRWEESVKTFLTPGVLFEELGFRYFGPIDGHDLNILVSEMVLARRLKQRRRGEYALIRRAPEESVFAVQLAGNQADEMAWAAELAESRGADFADINCGCPIDYFTSKGLGAALSRQPNKIRKIVAAMTAKVKIPVTVKIRLGWKTDERNAQIGRAHV